MYTIKCTRHETTIRLTKKNREDALETFADLLLWCVSSNAETYDIILIDPDYEIIANVDKK